VRVALALELEESVAEEDEALELEDATMVEEDEVPKEIVAGDVVAVMDAQSVEAFASPSSVMVNVVFP